MKVLSPLRFGLLLFIGILMIAGCKKEIEGPRLQVTPNPTQFARQAGTVMEFGINASAEDGLKTLRITKQASNSTTQTVLDTVLSGNNANFNYPFQIPAQGVSFINFVFTLEDMEGRKVSTPRKLVIQGSTLLEETSGFELEGVLGGTGANRAFNISSGGEFQITAETDSSTIDIMEYDTDDDGLLSRSWVSPSGLKFVQSNSFNYAQATFNSAKAIFDNNDQQDVIEGISVNDIFVIRYSTDPGRYAVVKIDQIVEETEEAYGYYRFHMKK